jgi:hypothetical protein
MWWVELVEELASGEERERKEEKNIPGASYLNESVSRYYYLESRGPLERN